MAVIIHPETRFPVGDPDVIPLAGTSLPDHVLMKAAADRFILSVSGFRTVFAADKDENSLSPLIDAPHAVVSALMASVFAQWMKENNPGKRVKILVGTDTRPTGPAIADVMLRAFISSGVGTAYSFIVAAPEIMAHAKYAAALETDHPDHADGFCYVSASHNPAGHNGVKFGLGTGGVLGPDDANALIARIREGMTDPSVPEAMMNLVSACPRAAIAEAFIGTMTEKRKARSSYILLSREIASGTGDIAGQERYFDGMQASLARHPVGVVAEMNGSARTLSIDADFLESSGCRVHTANGKPRDFAHRIVPEGESLEPCARILEAARERDPSFAFGYVPDCDGDRGNIVAWIDSESRARPLEAQEVFALSVLSELADLARQGAFDYDADMNARARVAVVVNDPTSMRINDIAAAFDADVYRAEVGEANVVNLAARVRESGSIVRIFGEGSNGGNITYPSAVRDPLQTMFAVLKLIALRDTAGSESLFRIWMRLSGREASFRNDFTLSDIIASLPPYSTTSVFEPRAGLTVRTQDHAELKRKFGAVFSREWETRGSDLGKLCGAVSWEAVSCNGTVETRNLDDFASSGRGGLKILLKDEVGKSVAFLWMRGSGTEPVFRVLVDVRGKADEAEKWLLDWLKSMILEADRA